jgi:BirA family biotin operon repressor/biotin-[acetyl-CoA-carboxylase] ligase
MIIGKMSQDWAKKAGLPYWYQEEASSTNSIAKDAALMEKESIRLYFTDFQTAGKGRGTNTWLSGKPGTALLSSWSFQTRNSPQPVLSPMMGLALYRAFQASFPSLSFSLKAPNDLYLKDKKVAGLLLENVTVGEKNRLVVGLGVNVFEAPALDSATCLQNYATEIGSQDWAQCLDRLLLELTMAIAGTGATLAKSSQEALLFALNANPILQEKYVRISAHGDLESQNRSIQWSEL